MKDKLVILDSTSPAAERVYAELRAAGATVAVYGPAPWAVDADRVDVGLASLMALYADDVIGGGLPAVLAS